jgi:hypothetical protein
MSVSCGKQMSGRLRPVAATPTQFARNWALDATIQAESWYFSTSVLSCVKPPHQGAVCGGALLYLINFPQGKDHSRELANKEKVL